MTDNEIIKALECCRQKEEHCHICPYNPVNDCCRRIQDDALDLINRQKAEIDILIRKKESLMDEIAEQQAEIERLKGENKQIRTDCRWCEEWQTTELLGERAKAIKEFAERLKGKAYYCEKIDRKDDFVVNETDIDNLVKEIVGGSVTDTNVGCK